MEASTFEHAQPEMWRLVAAYSDLYEVSNQGRVRRIATGRILKTQVTQGYPRVRLCRDGKSISFMVHRLVAIAFIPNSDLSLQVNHKNGNRADACVENLEWVTRQENIRHAIDTLGKMRGERHHKSKLKAHDVLAIRELCSTGQYSQNELATMYATTPAQISLITNNRIWRHLAGVNKPSWLSQLNRIKGMAKSIKSKPDVPPELLDLLESIVAFKA